MSAAINRRGAELGPGARARRSLAGFRRVRAKLNGFRVVSQAVQTFIQLDIGSPGIGYEGQRNAQIGPVRKGHVQLHSIGFQLLAEGLQTLDLETDVVQHPPFGRHGRGIGFRKRQVRTRHVGGEKPL